MSEAVSDHSPTIDCAVDLDAPPEKVWRALSVPAFRDRWLPPGDLGSAEPASSVPGREVSYRMREPEPPFIESTVTFRIAPGEAGGTRLTIVHQLTDARLTQSPRRPANANANGPLMRAA